MPFVLEGVEEGAVDHFGQNFYGDASGNVDSSKSENLEGKIARFGAVDRGPQIESLHTDRAGLIKAAFGDEGSRVGVGVLEDRMLDARRDEFVQGAETAAGKNQFPTDLGIAMTHEFKEFDLLVSARGKIGVSAFARNDFVTRPIPEQNAFTQAGAGGEEGT